MEVTLSSGKEVIDRAAGGVFKVGDDVLVDVSNSLDYGDWRRAVIKELYYYDLVTGRREFAEVEFMDGSTMRDRMTMFMERINK